MKRSEFLKRFGLGVAAAVTAPALLKGGEKVKASDVPENGKDIVFWRNKCDGPPAGWTGPCAASCYTAGKDVVAIGTGHPIWIDIKTHKEVNKFCVGYDYSYIH